MAIEYKKSVAIFSDVVTVEEAEVLLEWLLKNPKGKINLAECTHIHSANLQVLMTVKPPVAAWSKSENLQLWIAPLLS